jgi:hypothetical protein
MKDDAANPFAAVLTKPEAYSANPELLEIFERTMWPFLSHIIAELPDSLSGYEKLHEALRVFFSVDSRTIDTYIVMDSTKITAPLKFPDDTTWDARTEDLRMAKKGDVILARIDTRTPWEIEVQVVSSFLKDHDDRRQFSFSAGDFYTFRRNLKYVSSH